MPRGYSSEGYYGGARPIFSTMLGTWQVTSDDCAVKHCFIEESQPPVFTLFPSPILTISPTAAWCNKRHDMYDPLHHYTNTPLFHDVYDPLHQYTNTPLFHDVYDPLHHYTNTPLFHYSGIHVIRAPICAPKQGRTSLPPGHEQGPQRALEADHRAQRGQARVQ